MCKKLGDYSVFMAYRSKNDSLIIALTEKETCAPESGISEQTA